MHAYVRILYIIYIYVCVYVIIYMYGVCKNLFYTIHYVYIYTLLYVLVFVRVSHSTSKADNSDAPGAWIVRNKKFHPASDLA